MAKKNRGKYTAGHQRSWLWGKHPVMEVLEAGRWPVVEVYLSEHLSEEVRQKAITLAMEQGAIAQVAPPERLQDLAHVTDHQGFLARMGAYPYASVEEALAGGEEGDRNDGKAPLYILLDAIQDTFNFGAIIRSAEAMGAWAIFVGEERQAPVNSLVARSSAGAINRIPMAQVADLPVLALDLKKRGIRIVGADEKQDCLCTRHDFTGPTALVLGNEGHGIHPELLHCCDASVRIPMIGNIASLNVGAAAAVLIYEAWRQKNT